MESTWRLHGSGKIEHSRSSGQGAMSGDCLSAAGKYPKTGDIKEEALRPLVPGNGACTSPLER